MGQFDGFDATACDRAIDVLSYKLGKPGRHFCAAKRLLADKFNNAKTLYEFAVSIVCDNAGDLMRNGKAVIDSNGD